MIENTCSSCSRKIKIFITCTLGFVIMSIMQANLGIALVDGNSREDDQVPIYTHPKLDFHAKTRLLSAFLYGNLLAPVGGLLVRKFDPFWLYNLGITVMALLTILSPIIIHRSLLLFALCRMMMGTFQALARTSLIQTATSWKTLKDAVFFVALIAVGNNFGIAVSYSFTLFLIKNIGWDESFYIIGTLSLLVVMVGIYSFATENRPKKSELSKTIKVCIDAQYKKNRRKFPNPYVTILTSKSVYALNYIKFILAGGMGCSMYYGPQFIENISKNSTLPIIGILSSLINLGPMLAYPSSAVLLATLLHGQRYSAEKAHSINFYFGSVMATVFLISCAICSSPAYRICSLALFQTFVCFADLTTQIVPLYLTPRYAGFLSSLGTVSRTISSILLPLLWQYIESTGVADELKSSFIFIALLTSLSVPTFAVLISFKPLPATSDNEMMEDSPKRESEKIPGKTKAALPVVEVVVSNSDAS